MEAGEPSAAANVGIDIDGMADVQRKVRGFLGSVTADHDLARLVGEWGAELFMNEGEGVLL